MRTTLFLAARNWNTRIDALLNHCEGRADLKRRLGTRCFDDDGEEVGHFWGIIETRPYMRILQAIVRLTFETRDYQKSA